MTCVEGQKRRSPNQRPFVLTRSFFVGSQRNGPMWTGDIFSNWDHLSYVLPMMLSLSLGSISFTGSDVPGFFKDPTEVGLCSLFHCIGTCYSLVSIWCLDAFLPCSCSYRYKT